MHQASPRSWLHAYTVRASVRIASLSPPHTQLCAAFHSHITSINCKGCWSYNLDWIMFLLLFTAHWIMFLLSLSFVYYNYTLYQKHQHLMDVTEIFNHISKEKK